MIPLVQLDSSSAIDAAKEALDHYGRFWLGNVKVESEFYDLGLLSAEERYMAVDIALQEISSACRMGPQPPGDVSSHPPFRGQHLYAFCWNSQEFKREMYFKFALVVSASGETRVAVSGGPAVLALYSFHEATDKDFGGIT